MRSRATVTSAVLPLRYSLPAAPIICTSITVMPGAARSASLAATAAKTALRHLERERAELRERMITLPGPKDRLEDHIIAVVRPDYDDEAWSTVLEVARATRDAEAR